MKKIQVQGVHHITIVGSTKKSAVDFWQGVLGMPFIFEQPNLGNPDENHLYFDPGDGRLLTVFTNETRQDAGRPAPREVGSVDHIALNVSRATFKEAPARLTEHGISFYERDRGFMDSIYLKDDLLFGYMEYHGTDFNADMAKMAADPKTQEWWKIMQPIQQPLSGTREGEWWTEMEEVFHVD